MNATKNIYDQAPETFLNEKIEHHRQQIKFHKHEMDEARRKLLILTASTKEKSEDAKEEKSGNMLIHPDSDFRLTTWKPKVFDALAKSDTALVSEEILLLIDKRYVDDKELRKKAIGAISNSLQTLMRENKVTREENAGRGNRYRLNNEAQELSGAS